MLKLWIVLLSFPLIIPSLSCAQALTQTQASYNEYFELGLAGNYRKVYLTEVGSTERAFDENSAYTASLAYYFREMTALELSYSQGKNTRYIPSSTITSTTTHRYNLVGLDLLFTFGKRTDQFIPYIKAGIAYFDKKSIDYEYVQNGIPISAQTVNLDSIVVPSAGFGIQYRLTQRVAFKAGLEFWTSGPINRDLGDFDWAARVGISWFL